MPVELSGSRVLLTGATGGLGHAIARGLHAHGAHLILTGRRAEVLDGLVAELGERVEARALDLANADEVHRFAAELGDIDVFVANAGLPGTGQLAEYTSEQIDRVIDVNLRSPIHMTHALLPGMLDRGRGHLVYISSISGKVATSYSSLYNATKFGLRGFSFAIHEDLRGTGVGATAVFPGAVADAGMWADGGLDLPPGVKPSKPAAVADAVIEGIEKDKPEINVGNPVERLGALLAGPAPRVVSFINRHGPTNKIAAELAERQVEKR
jgi:short-subunit dehydrogenase